MIIAATSLCGGTIHSPEGRADALVIVLHGVGSNADAMQPLVSALAGTFPATAVVAPDGFEPFDMGETGRQWFSVRGVTEANRRERVEATLPAILALVSKLREQFGLAADRVALVGFSQGAIMALHVAATSEPPAAVVAFAGRLVAPISGGAMYKPAVMLSHGEMDAVIPPAETHAAARAFSEVGFSVQMQIVPGQQHSVSAIQIAAMVAFLKVSLNLAQD